MSDYVGIPIKLLTYDEKGEPTGNFETAVFATARKCSALLKCFRDMAKAEVADSKATRKAVFAAKKLNAAETEEEIDTAAELADKAATTSEQTQQALMDAIFSFVTTGFKGAGYTAEEAERYAELVEPKRLMELKAASQYGSTRQLDFTKEPETDLKED